MGLEAGTTISSFITSNPTETDPVNQGDNHIRLIKSVLQAQFPGSIGTGFNTPITATEAELNSLHNSGIGNLVANVHADGSGNVGIGTASPAQKLHVVEIVMYQEQHYLQTQDLCLTLMQDKTQECHGHLMA